MAGNDEGDRKDGKGATSDKGLVRGRQPAAALFVSEGRTADHEAVRPPSDDRGQSSGSEGRKRQGA